MSREREHPGSPRGPGGARGSGGAHRPGDAERSAFREAMQGVKALAGRRKAQPPTRATAPKPMDAPDTPVRFELLHTGARLEGRAPGIDRKHLRRLRSGDLPVEVRIDLHGLDVRSARAVVRDALLAADAAGQRCALVIHGRGHHSAGDPVLKRALPEWLAEPPLGARVMAFTSATPADGGAGATYVLLRRRAPEMRARRRGSILPP